MSLAILNRNIWFLKCYRYRGSSRQFKTLESTLITYNKIRPYGSSYVATSLCPSFSSKQNDVSNVEKKTFQELMFDRRRQAHCSVIVEVNSYYSLSYLCKHIEKLAKVKKIFHRKFNSEKEYFLIECENLSDVRSLLKKCNYSESSDSIPVFSKILRYNDVQINKEESLQISCETYNVVPDTTINKKLLLSENVTEQMKELQRCEQLSEINTRLHFFICSQIEDAVCGLFPSSICLPFGSAVNGFGCVSGDLDMSLNLNGKENSNDSLLSFIPKKTLSYDRFQEQRMLETVGDMLQTFVPGICQLVRILKARVPILKFQHDIAKIQCDLTINNMSGVHMAEFLYLYGEMHPCVRPLVHTIRRWARKNELISDGAGSKITNFSLILMIIFFLQTRINPILPPISRINYSENKSACSNIVMSENSNNDIQSNNSDSNDLEPLLKEFFLFCATFNFEQAMCLVTGTATPKPDYSSLYIHNPIETGLNVSKNVVHPELKKVKEAARNALWQLEKSSDNNDRRESWGILKLFVKQKQLSNEEINKRFQISSLFEKKNIDFAQKHQQNIIGDEIDRAQTKRKTKRQRKLKT